MEYEIDRESLKEFNAESVLINKQNKERLKCCSFNSKLHTYNWLEDYPEMQDCTNLVEVQFKNTRKCFYVNSNNIELNQGDMVAVEALPGHDIGAVTLTGKLVLLQMKKNNFRPNDNGLRRIYRIARDGDLEKYELAKSREELTMIRAREIAQDLGLDMKIGDVEYQGDGNKAIFYYIADDRVDFRELIKILASEFRVKIEMKQIGARQEAGRIGGIGPCGRQLCCSLWLTNFVSVSTSAARIQELSINPQKLAGQCAKLKCCLNYEVDAYIEAQKKLPSREVVLDTKDGLYYHFKTDIFSGMMTYSLGGNSMSNLVTIHKDRVYEVISLNRKDIKPTKLVTEAQESLAPKEVYGGNSLNEDSITRFDSSGQSNSKKKRSKSSVRRRNKSNPGQNKGPVQDDNFVRCFSGLIIFVCLVSCNQNEVYYKFTSIPQNEWNNENEICFVIDSSSSVIPDHSYTISLEITHNITYPYKNLFLYLNHTQDSISSRDTIECALVDDLGKWLGSGNGATRQLSVLYKTNFKIDTTLHNEICIRHAMQDLKLKGIERIGLRIY